MAGVLENPPVTKGKVAIVGSGVVGRSFTMIFISAGYNVHIYDTSKDQIEDALQDIHGQLTKLQSIGLLRGKLSAEEQFKLIELAPSLSHCVEGAVYIQECIPERLQLKQDMFAKLDEMVTSDKTVMASSTSATPASKFTEKLKHRSQCIVVHPVNPPYYCPLVEIVPAPWTGADITQLANQIMLEVGQKPIVFKKEILGFGVNRIQWVCRWASWQLVEDDALDPDDVDKIMKYGLGMRYAFMGNFETMHLNRKGFLDNIERIGKSMNEVLTDLGPVPDFDPKSETAKKISDAMIRKTPLETLPSRRKWRDERLVALWRLKKELEDDQ